MYKCDNCNITIYDNVDVCPLCHQVIDEISKEEEAEVVKVFGASSPYPDVKRIVQRTELAMKLIVFLSILAEVILIGINYFKTPKIMWSLISGIAFVYLLLSLKYWISHDSGFAIKLGIQITLTMIILAVLDHFTGSKGWSFEWAIPGIILFGDAMALFLMMLNRQRWYSYTMFLLYMELLSVAVMVLHFFNKITNIVMPITCIALSSLFMLATIIFGDRAFYREFKRRFRV